MVQNRRCQEKVIMDHHCGQQEQICGAECLFTKELLRLFVVTHSEKSHFRRMKTWPYRQEFHEKRICCTVEACTFGKVCTNSLLRTVGDASCPEVVSEN